MNAVLPVGDGHGVGSLRNRSAILEQHREVLGQPLYRLLGDLVELRVERSCFHDRARTDEDSAVLCPSAVELGDTVFMSGTPGHYEWVETTRSIMLAVGQVERMRRSFVSRRLS